MGRMWFVEYEWGRMRNNLKIGRFLNLTAKPRDLAGQNPVKGFEFRMRIQKTS